MYIENINGPADVKKLNIAQMTVLASEMRDALLTKLSRHGGHFGPNFGMVEATIALHYVFESPKDKFVFDVSHQSYPHKMLTGRKDAFLYEEHYDDVSGYSSPHESEHDHFTIGHTSTSVSLACGLAKGRDLKGEDGNVVAIIGDGSLSGGEALEALDYAAEQDGNLIILVIDNDMSIAENHGGLYQNLRLLRETGGGMYSFNYLFNLCILGVFLIVALFIGLQLRPLLLNLNLLFDKQLSTTGMMICESNDLPRQRYSLRTAMRVMLDSDSYRRELLDHAVAFEHRYPYYIKGGFAAVVGVQVLLFVLSTVLDIDNNGKIILLVIWIISVIAICGWLINIEYIRASLNTQMRISALSDEDLRREMREHTAAIPAARHMFGLNASERGAKGGDQSTGRLPHIGSHHKSQGSDSTATNDGDTTALGKHSKGGEA